MLKELIGNHGSVLPQIALVLFVLIAVFILIYMFTDRRRGHRERMEAMPLNDGIPVKKDEP